MKKVRIPFCLVFLDTNGCSNGKPLPDSHGMGGGYRVVSADCIGADELGQSFRFARFTCGIVTAYVPRTGHVAVYVSGPDTFRWKTL